MVCGCRDGEPPGSTVELRRLTSFVAVTEDPHFGHAADRLCLAPSALSAQIKVLETELGSSPPPPSPAYSPGCRQPDLTAVCLLVEDLVLAVPEEHRPAGSQAVAAA